MLPQELLVFIGRRHFIAEIRTETAQQALGTIESLIRGGITVFEVAQSIPGYEEILRHFSKYPDVIVGSGGILEAHQGINAAHAGARFLSSPIVAPDIVQVCQELHLIPILGGLTPTEIIMAQRAGAELVKVFPVNALGGSAYVRGLFRHLTHLSLIVSGGITLDNIAEYLSLPIRAFGLGSSLTPRSLVERGDWNSITQIARYFVEYIASWDSAQLQANTQNPYSNTPIMTDTTYMPMAQPAYYQQQAASGYPAQVAAQFQPDPQYPAYEHVPQQPFQQSQPNAVSQPPIIPASSRPGQSQVPSLEEEEEFEAFAEHSFRPWDSHQVNQDGKDEWIR